MKEILSNDELWRLHMEGGGLIYNDFGTEHGNEAEWNVLHLASCGTVQMMLVKDPKYFFQDIEEAIGWLNSQRGREGVDWKRCDRCFRRR